MSSMHYVPHAQQVRALDTEQLRQHFLLADLFQAGRVALRALDLDRALVGGAVPTNTPLTLEAPAALAAEFLTERRELGVLNIGAAGAVTVDGQIYAMANRDGLYIGRGAVDITLSSESASDPARFYLISYPAHAQLPTAHLPRRNAQVTELGSTENANRRRICKYFHPDGIKTAQLVMGVTELSVGSVWNTMPPHTHARRTEIYLYFDLPQEAAVFHFLGEPDHLRSLVVRDGQAVLSPGWSIHAGCGTTSYSFCWAMGGENQTFSDMQAVALQELR